MHDVTLIFGIITWITGNSYEISHLQFQGIDLARIASFKPSSGSHHANNNNSGNGLASGGGTASGSVTVLDMERGPISSGIGFYRGNVVFIKRIHKKSIDLTRDIRKELIRVSSMTSFIHFGVLRLFVHIPLSIGTLVLSCHLSSLSKH